MTTQRPDPLPRDWLPDPAGPGAEDTETWDDRVRRVVARADSRLDRRARERRHAETPWWDALGRQWRSAAALAAAAGLLLALAPSPPANRGRTDASMVLAAVASDGEPVSVWRAAARSGNPVLAALVLEQGETP